MRPQSPLRPKRCGPNQRRKTRPGIVPAGLERLNSGVYDAAREPVANRARVSTLADSPSECCLLGEIHLSWTGATDGRAPHVLCDPPVFETYALLKRMTGSRARSASSNVSALERFRPARFGGSWIASPAPDKSEIMPAIFGASPRLAKEYRLPTALWVQAVGAGNHPHRE